MQLCPGTSGPLDTVSRWGEGVALITGNSLCLGDILLIPDLGCPSSSSLLTHSVTTIVFFPDPPQLADALQSSFLITLTHSFTTFSFFLAFSFASCSTSRETHGGLSYTNSRPLQSDRGQVQVLTPPHSKATLPWPWPLTQAFPLTSVPLLQQSSPIRHS